MDIGLSKSVAQRFPHSPYDTTDVRNGVDIGLSKSVAQRFPEWVIRRLFTRACACVPHREGLPLFNVNR